MTLTLEKNEFDYILSVLGGRPFNEVAQVYMKLQAQAWQQTQRGRDGNSSREGPSVGATGPIGGGFGDLAME
jgi:hypothetical protein